MAKFAALVFAWLVLGAHDWMTPEMLWCCNDKDCHPGVVKRTADGWYLPEYNMTFKEGQRGVYPNLRPDITDAWVCKMPSEEKPRCIMVLPEGS